MILSYSKYKQFHASVLAKKIEYLKSHGRGKEVEAVMEEYKYAPDVCSFKINCCLLKVLMDNVASFSRVELFKTYTPYMSEGDQATYMRLLKN